MPLYSLEDLKLIEEILSQYLLDFPEAEDVNELLEQTCLMIVEFENGH